MQIIGIIIDKLFRLITILFQNVNASVLIPTFKLLIIISNFLTIREEGCSLFLEPMKQALSNKSKQQ